jgi:hypothetical protein
MPLADVAQGKDVRGMPESIPRGNFFKRKRLRKSVAAGIKD